MSFETPSPTNRLANVQALRGIAALLVVLSHLLVMESKYSPDQLLGTWASYGIAGVDLFFVISGFIMVYITQNTQKGTHAIGSFLFARASRIYPLYWLITTALLALYLLRPDIVFANVDLRPSIWKSYALWPDLRPENSMATRPPLLAVGWTLVHEVFFYLVFAISLFFSRKFLPLFLTLWTLLFLAGNIAQFDEIRKPVRIFFHPMTAEFLMGAFAALIYLNAKGKGATLSLLLAPLAFLLGLYFIPLTDENMWTRVGIFGVPALLVVYGLSGIELAGKQSPKCLQTLGDWSYSLYLTHVLSLSLIGRLWRKFTGESIWDNIFALIIMTVFSIVVAGLTYRLAEKPMLLLAKNLRRRFFSPT